MFRLVRVVPALVLLAAAATGCGGQPDPAPVELTPQLLEQAKIQDKQVEQEERLQQKLGFRDKPEDLVQKQVDQEERAHLKAEREAGKK